MLEFIHINIENVNCLACGSNILSKYSVMFKNYLSSNHVSACYDSAHTRQNILVQRKNADVFFPNLSSNDFNSTRPECFWLLFVINPSGSKKIVAEIFKGASEGESHEFFLAYANDVQAYWLQSESLFFVAILLL